MTMTMVTVTLIVLFGALLAGKMLKDMFPGTLKTAFKDPDAEHTPAE